MLTPLPSREPCVKYSGNTTSDAPLSLAAFTACETQARFRRMLANTSKSTEVVASSRKVRGPSAGWVCAIEILIAEGCGWRVQRDAGT